MLLAMQFLYVSGFPILGRAVTFIIYLLVNLIPKRRWENRHEGEDKELECGGDVAVGSQGRHVRDLQDGL